MQPLDILYRDDNLVVINKPHGLLVHRTKIAADANRFAVQELRNQLGKMVYPIHRLDRKTAGCLIFALDQKTNKILGQQFQERRVEKKYHAIVRGHLHGDGVINYPLINDKDKKQEAITKFCTLQQFEIDVPLGKHLTSRYSLVELIPKTGRFHQLRKHMNHMRHPIIGDRPHGCSKQNRLWKGRFSMETMMLHAIEIKFKHPFSDTQLTINADYSIEFKRVLNLLNGNMILG